MKQLVTIKVNSTTLEQMRSFYKKDMIPNEGEYIDFFAKTKDITIAAYLSKKEDSKVVFNGENALKEALIWDPNAEIKEAKAKIKEEWVCLENQIGSDEVGVGDFLLPMIVVASFVRKKDLKILKEYNVHDSKKLSDKEILEIGESLAKKVFISRLTLPNEKYNEMILKGENLNSLKAKMHNRALLNLFKQFPDTKHIFVDQFCTPEKYFSYLNDAKEIQIKNITFATKGESRFPSVALASVMARYCFLLEKEKLEDKYGLKFPLGAGKKVDEFSKEFIYKFGIKEFEKIAKKNFANYREVLEEKLF